MLASLRRREIGTGRRDRRRPRASAQGVGHASVPPSLAFPISSVLPERHDRGRLVLLGFSRDGQFVVG